VVLAQWENLERHHVLLTALRAVGTTVLILAVYYVVPIDDHPRHSILLRLSIGMALFVAALAYEMRAIVRAKRPLLRAADAMALVVPLFIVVFAFTYLTMSRSSPASFSEPLDRTPALYFAVTVFATVGFGDIVARTNPARLVVTVQMMLDLIVIAVVARLLLGAARGAHESRTQNG
jgi:voltage-gated potassium channel